MLRVEKRGDVRWAAMLLGLAVIAACSASTDDTVVRDVPRDVRDGADDARPPTDVPPERCGHEREPCCSGTACGPGLTCSAGTCSAAEACGREGQPCCSGLACGAELVCTGGTCIDEPACGGERQPCCAGGACRSGLVCERDSCVATAACGALRQPCCSGTACASGLVCTSGVCESAPACGAARQPCCGGGACNEGLVCTSGTCQTAPSACGELGQSCCGGTSCTAAGATCCSGACVDTARDPRNCGACGSRCDGTCRDSRCETVTCGGEGQACCTSGERCRTGLECNASSQCARTAAACSPVGAACTSLTECCATLNCRGAPDTSQCCVESGGTCATSSDCCGWMSCVEGHCACQPGSDICTLTGDCCSGLTCTDEVCSTAGSTDPCAAAGDCAACTAGASCGWCGASNSCMTGAIAGPTTGTCGSGWAWYASSCGGTADPCAANTDCASCNSISTCGWCRASGTCATGGSGGPTSGGCADWVWYVSACETTAPDPCDANASCGSCTVEAGCGWCGDTTSCRSGTSGGPSAGSCGDWNWYSFDCPTDECAGTTDCEECTSTAACGWCNSSSSCQTGSWSGPASGSCGDWAWYTSACASADPCNDWWNCEDCNSQASCGWCAATWSCMTGGGAGPSSGSCSDWRYYVADCVTSDPCEAHGDCAACTGDAACGWCDASWTCMTGGPTGPDSGSCSDWRYNASECAAPDPCNTHWDCAACTGDAACGWCAASSTCMTGGPTGPDAGSCGDWRYNASECVTTDPCEVNADCGSCTAASACGWCEADYTCMTGDSGGPDSGWCTDWRYNPTSCPAPPDPCDVHTDCGGCTADAGCGWCEATWSCQTGGSSGPTGGYCSDWRYYASDCAPPDPCNSHWDCGSCTGDAACGWCEADYTCMTGGASGPASGSCGDWRYYDYDCP